MALVPPRVCVAQVALAEQARVAALSPADLASFLQHGVAVYWADVLRQPLSAPHPPQWCGAFALWCLHKGGLGLDLCWMFGPPHFGFLWKLHQLQRAQGEVPMPGDIAYLDRPYQHHAVVVCVEGDTVHTVDGNQGPRAPIQKYERPLTHWTAFYSIASLMLPEERGDVA